MTWTYWSRRAESRQLWSGLISPLIALMKTNKNRDQSRPGEFPWPQSSDHSKGAGLREAGRNVVGGGGWNGIWNSQMEINSADPAFWSPSGLLLNIYECTEEVSRYRMCLHVSLLFLTRTIHEEKHILHTGILTVCRSFFLNPFFSLACTPSVTSYCITL